MQSLFRVVGFSTAAFEICGSTNHLDTRKSADGSEAGLQLGILIAKEIRVGGGLGGGFYSLLGGAWELRTLARGVEA